MSISEPAPVFFAAFIALFRFKVGIVPVIASCAAIGLAYSLLL
jgi:chromate transporter